MGRLLQLGKLPPDRGRFLQPGKVTLSWRGYLPDDSMKTGDIASLVRSGASGEYLRRGRIPDGADAGGTGPAVESGRIRLLQGLERGYVRF